MEFVELIRRTCAAIVEDGRVTLGETALLMRIVKPFAAQGDADAIALEKSLRDVREDGVVTPEESNALCEKLTAFADRVAQAD